MACSVICGCHSWIVILKLLAILALAGATDDRKVGLSAAGPLFKRVAGLSPSPEITNESSGAGCDTSCTFHGVSATCADRVQWAARHTFSQNPEACEEAHKQVLQDCPVCAVCQAADAGCKESSRSQPPVPDDSVTEACLCIFDVDRTLTGIQGDINHCPNNSIQDGVQDPAYEGGQLTLSVLMKKLQTTFCGACYIGTISAGVVSGPTRQVLHQHLSVVPGKLPTDMWSQGGCTATDSPLIVSCTDGQKQLAVPQIIHWYKDYAHANVADSQVYFFDDSPYNVEPFRGTPYNARQVSCRTRDAGHSGIIGFCGPDLDEIQPTQGVVMCEEHVIYP